MSGRRWAALLAPALVTVTGEAGAAAAPPAVFVIESYRGDSEANAQNVRWGYGCIIEWPSAKTGRPTVGILTAFHVVHGADGIRIARVPKDGIPPDVIYGPRGTTRELVVDWDIHKISQRPSVFVWPSLDLAIVDLEARRDDARLRGLTLCRMLAAPIPAGLFVYAVNDPPNVHNLRTPPVRAEVHGFITAGEHAKRLAEETSASEMAILGSTQRSANYIYYKGPFLGGMSGAPVLTALGSDAVIGIHLGGVAASWEPQAGNQTRSGWAIMLDALPDPEVIRFGHWPAYEEPQFAQAKDDLYPAAWRFSRWAAFNRRPSLGLGLSRDHGLAGPDVTSDLYLATVGLGFQVRGVATASILADVGFKLVVPRFCDATQCSGYGLGFAPELGVSTTVIGWVQLGASFSLVASWLHRQAANAFLTSFRLGPFVGLRISALEVRLGAFASGTRLFESAWSQDPDPHGWLGWGSMLEVRYWFGSRLNVPDLL